MNYSLYRFIEVQSRIYPYVLEELAAGDKQSHWMWFVFPHSNAESMVAER